jgi:hypothetical protein
MDHLIAFINTIAHSPFGQALQHELGNAAAAAVVHCILRFII